MSKDIINTAILATAFLLLFGVAEIFYHKLKVKVELTRKLVHFGTGIITLFFPLMLSNQWFVLFLCGSFAIILLTSLKFNLLRSINAIERKSYGSILYPVAVYGCYLVYNYYTNKFGKTDDVYIYFYLPILTLAICDPMAALFGKKFPYGKFKVGKDTKTIVGTSAFFVSSFILSAAMLSCLGKSSLGTLDLFLISSAIAFTSCIVEAFSGKGRDNITIPACVMTVLIFLL
ncbi:MAG TPA: phosphatidate cytidylyltransferase [Bacteroidia bacterium]|nr:phosphatidate cytidylyltransferase [Bacteroidia bacterium]